MRLTNATLAVTCFTLALASCDAAPLKQIDAPVPVAGTCATVPLTDAASPQCLSVKMSVTGGKPVKRSFVVEATGPESWTTAVAVTLTAPDGADCTVDFAENGKLKCGEFLVSDQESVVTDITVSSGSKTDVALTLEMNDL